MSIFYQNPPAQKQSKQEDITWQQAAAVVITILVIIIYYKWPKFEGWYFNHFEEIYISLYGVGAAFFGLVYWAIVKYTKDLTKRMRLLSPVSHSGNGLYVGTTSDGIEIHVPDKVRAGHVQILGSTGRGKTESVIIPWMGRDILKGRNVILMDGKGDPEIVDRIKAIALRKNPQPEVFVFDLGNPKNSCTTNPLAFGSAQQITDRIFTAIEFGDEYYKSVQYDICGAIVELMRSENLDKSAEQNREVTFHALHRYITDEAALSELVGRKNNPVLQRRLSEFLSLSKEDRTKKMSKLQSDLAPFATGEVAPLVNGKQDGKIYASLSEIMLENSKNQKIFLILLPTLKYQQLGHQLGKILMQEIGWIVGERASRLGKNAAFTPVYLDEFSSFVYPGFENILNKARSSKIPFHLSHQSLGDLSRASKDFAQIVNTNTNVKCVLGLNDPDTANWMAQHMGTKTTEKLTEQAEKKGFFEPNKKTGAMSIREVEEFKIHPNSLKEYVNGMGVIHFPSDRGSITEEMQFERLSLDDLLTGGSN